MASTHRHLNIFSVDSCFYALFAQKRPGLYSSHESMPSEWVPKQKLLFQPASSGNTNALFGKQNYKQHTCYLWSANLYGRCVPTVAHKKRNLVPQILLSLGARCSVQNTQVTLVWMGRKTSLVHDDRLSCSMHKMHVGEYAWEKNKFERKYNSGFLLFKVELISDFGPHARASTLVWVYALCWCLCVLSELRRKHELIHCNVAITLIAITRKCYLKANQWSCAQQACGVGNPLMDVNGNTMFQGPSHAHKYLKWKAKSSLLFL